MPREIRQIQFSKAEVIEAVARHAAAKGRTLAHGDIVSCSFAETPVPSVVLVVRDRLDRGFTLAPVPMELVAAALIRRCRELAIPVPKQADKTLRPAGERLALIFRLSHRRPATAAT